MDTGEEQVKEIHPLILKENMKNENSLLYWIRAARPGTWLVSISPVLIGTAIAISMNSYSTRYTLAIMLASLLIQIGTNLANDYYDGLKGADEHRVGPRRLSQDANISLTSVRVGFIGVLGLAAIIGIALVYRGGWPILAIGVSSLFFAVFYTKGRFALAYTGLADLICFLYFGPIAVAGTAYLHTLTWSKEAFILGCIPGALSVAILTVNNIRDRASDAKVNKRSLVVRFGKGFGLAEYSLAHIASILCLFWAGLYYSLLWAPVSLYLIIQVHHERALNTVLKQTAIFLFLICLSLSMNILAIYVSNA